VVLFLPWVQGLQEILTLPFHLSFLLNLVIHPILSPPQSLVLLVVLEVQAVQMLRQNLDPPLIQQVQVLQEGLIYSKIYINVKLILISLKKYINSGHECKNIPLLHSALRVILMQMFQNILTLSLAVGVFKHHPTLAGLLKVKNAGSINSFFYINSFIHSFIPLACAECDNSLAFSGASSIPLCYILFPATLLHQLFFHPPSLHLAIYFLIYLLFFFTSMQIIIHDSSLKEIL
jgi:hypothetical protein